MSATFWDRALRFWFCAFLITLIAYLCGVRFYRSSGASPTGPAPAKACAAEPGVQVLPPPAAGQFTPNPRTVDNSERNISETHTVRGQYNRLATARNNGQPGSLALTRAAIPASFRGGPVSLVTERTSKAGTVAGRVEHVARTERPAAKLRTRKVVCIVTAYCNCFLCCGKHPGDKGYGITASGRRAGIGTCATDTKVLPRFTQIEVPGYGRAVATDTGGAIRGRRIDLWFPTHAQARQFGRQTLIAKVLE
jgi:3D (Asp-Asp-Asp) domain-containing protein